MASNMNTNMNIRVRKGAHLAEKDPTIWWGLYGRAHRRRERLLGGRGGSKRCEGRNLLMLRPLRSHGKGGAAGLMAITPAGWWCGRTRGPLRAEHASKARTGPCSAPCGEPAR